MAVKGDDLPDNENIEKYLDLNLKLLSCIGMNINLSEDHIIKKRKFRERIPALIIIGLQVYCAVSQILLIRESIGEGQYISASQISCDLFSNILISSKGCQLVIATIQVETLLWELASLWRKYMPSHRIRKINILKKASNVRLVCQIFVLFTICGVPMYGLPSVLNLISLYTHRNDVSNYTRDYDKRIFFMKYPFEIKNFQTYFLVIVEEGYLLYGTAIFWMCADTLFAQILSHTSLQFEILSDEIVILMNEKTDESTFKEKFAILIERHKHLLRICGRIEELYSSVVLITMVLSSLNICFNIFAAMEMSDSGQYKAAVVHIFLAINTVIEIAFYCFFAEALTEQTSAIGNAIYNSKWTDNDYKLSIYVKMLIIKSQNPFYCTAYGYFPIGHTRLTKILNAALSYLMMLRATT